MFEGVSTKGIWFLWLWCCLSVLILRVAYACELRVTGIHWIICGFGVVVSEGFILLDGLL